MTRFVASIHNFINREQAQDAFEYVLVIGGITVAVIMAVATPVGGSIITAVVKGTCSAIDGIPNMSAFVNCP